MKKDFDIKFDRGDVVKFKNKMRMLKLFANEEFYDALQNGAANAVKIAQRTVPVKTGDLKRSIHVGGDKKNIFVGAEMKYAEAVEFGTTKQKAQPYFFPSIRTAMKIMIMNIKYQIVKISKL